MVRKKSTARKTTGLSLSARKSLARRAVCKTGPILKAAMRKSANLFKRKGATISKSTPQLSLNLKIHVMNEIKVILEGTGPLIPQEALIKEVTISQNIAPMDTVSAQQEESEAQIVSLMENSNLENIDTMDIVD